VRLVNRLRPQRRRPQRGRLSPGTDDELDLEHMLLNDVTNSVTKPEPKPKRKYERKKKL
jgi:hypothetical protein